MEKFYEINFKNGEVAENTKVTKWLNKSLAKAFRQNIKGVPSSFEEFKRFTLNLLEEKEAEILRNEYYSWEPTGPYIYATERGKYKKFCYHSVADFIKGHLLKNYTPGQR